MMQRLVQNARLIAIAVAAAALAGCAIDLPGSRPPPDLFDLSPKSTFDDNLPQVGWQLVVEEPTAQKAVDTDRIAIRPNPRELKYFAGVRWTDRAPSLIQSLLVESFDNSGRIVGVGRRAVGLTGDLLLKTELREFQAELFEGQTAPLIRVRITAKLIRQPRGVIVASESFERTAQAASQNVPDVVNAFDEATGSVFKRIVEWTLRSGEGMGMEGEMTPES